MDRHPLSGKHIGLGVTGGIAAYKAADLASRLVKLGAVVDVIMTAEAREFVAPLTFQALTHRPVIADMFQLLEQTEIGHVALAYRLDLLIVAPATAHTLARLAHGLADDMLTATALATRAPLLLAPAMESGMWDNPLTQRNLETLRRERGAVTVGPEEGRLASGRSGVGRMAQPADIVEAATRLLARDGDLAGVRVLVTAGGTREPIDPVRYVGNRSSGKMGYALAEAARNRGAAVTLVTTAGLPLPAGVTVRAVETAREMAAAVLDALAFADVLIMAAAVADFRPEESAAEKLKREGRDALVVRLVPNPDILAEAGRARGDAPRPLLVGFAAETQDLLRNAQAKLEKKRLDLLVANDVSAEGSGFGADTNQVTLLAPGAPPETLPLQSKLDVAHAVLDRVAALLRK